MTIETGHYRATSVCFICHMAFLCNKKIHVELCAITVCLLAQPVNSADGRQVVRLLKNINLHKAEVECIVVKTFTIFVAGAK